MKDNFTIAIIFLLMGLNSTNLYLINNIEIIGWQGAITLLLSSIYAIKGLYSQSHGGKS